MPVAHCRSASRIASGLIGRLHGSPRVYYSAYPDDVLECISTRVEQSAAAGARTWGIFDNTALGAATGDALKVKSLLLEMHGIFC